jgi:hypothetical protein
MKQDSTHEIYRDIVDAATHGSCPHIGKSGHPIDPRAVTQRGYRVDGGKHRLDPAAAT